MGPRLGLWPPREVGRGPDSWVVATVEPYSPVVDGFFRAGVAALIVNHEGLVLGAERADIPGAWQVPQGGLGDREEPRDAVRRELTEELDISWDRLTVVAVHPEWLVYELPPGDRNAKVGRGQAHTWFLLRYSGLDTPGPRDAEFIRTAWMSISQLRQRTWFVRRPALELLTERWSAHLHVEPHAGHGEGQQHP